MNILVKFANDESGATVGGRAEAEFPLRSSAVQRMSLLVA